MKARSDLEARNPWQQSRVSRALCGAPKASMSTRLRVRLATRDMRPRWQFHAIRKDHPDDLSNGANNHLIKRMPSRSMITRP